MAYIKKQYGKKNYQRSIQRKPYEALNEQFPVWLQIMIMNYDCNISWKKSIENIDRELICTT